MVACSGGIFRRHSGGAFFVRRELRKSMRFNRQLGQQIRRGQDRKAKLREV